MFAFVNGNLITLLISHVYICLQFVYKRIRNTRHGVDDVSCDNSRAERVGRILAASFTAVNIVYERKQRLWPGGGDVSLSASRAERARLRSPLAVGMLIDERLDHRRDLLLL